MRWRYDVRRRYDAYDAAADVLGFVALVVMVVGFVMCGQACADAPPRVRVRVTYTQPCVPPGVDEFVIAGAQAWRSVDIDYVTSSSAPACEPRWFDAPTPCTLTVRVTFADLGPYAGLRAGNDIQLAYQAQGFDLASTMAHELGHAVFDSGDHLAPGLSGIMEAGERGDTSPTDADLDYVAAHAPAFYRRQRKPNKKRNTTGRPKRITPRSPRNTTPRRRRRVIQRAPRNTPRARGPQGETGAQVVARLKADITSNRPIPSANARIREKGRDKPVISIRLEPKTLAALDAAALSLGRPRTQVIERALDAWLHEAHKGNVQGFL